MAETIDRTDVPMVVQDESMDDDAADNRRPRRGASWILVAGLLVVSNVVTFALASQSYLQFSSPDQFLTATNGDRKPTASIDTSLHLTTFTGLKFIPNDFAAVAGGEIDVDAAWRSIGTYFDRFLVSQEEAADFPELTSDHVFLTPDSIIDENVSIPHSGYPVFMEAFHQLHCIDLMRQALYFNVDYYRSRASGPWAAEDHWIQNHVQHCLDYLRRLAMCHSETGLIQFYWRNQEGDTVLDYRQERQCGNFESVLEWAEKHQVDLAGGDVKLRPPENATFKAVDLHSKESPVD